MKKKIYVSASEPFVVDGLKKFGYDVIETLPNIQLDKAIRTHADCALFTPDGKTFFIEQSNYETLVKYLTRGENERFQKKDRRFIQVCDIKSPYPKDVKLNCKCFGKKILCNISLVSTEIKEFAEKNNYKLIHCNQGYAACSTVKLNENAAITDDESVYNALIDNGIDCIKVSKGSVKLKGFDYGFIGGCCGMPETNKIIFTGNIDKHSDADIIINFINKYSVEIVSLCDGELIDVGGIIPLDY